MPLYSRQGDETGEAPAVFRITALASKDPIEFDGHPPLDLWIGNRNDTTEIQFENVNGDLYQLTALAVFSENADGPIRVRCSPLIPLVRHNNKPQGRGHIPAYDDQDPRPGLPLPDERTDENLDDYCRARMEWEQRHPEAEEEEDDDVDDQDEGDYGPYMHLEP